MSSHEGTRWIYFAVLLALLVSVPGGAQHAASIDADGDRLPDDWERCGVAPSETDLPSADGERMTLYLQVQYAEGVEPLSDAEKRQLERHWAEMPVENPDGTTGIDLRIDDSPPRGGALDRRIALDGNLTELRAQSSDLRETYYASERLGARAGVYHQALLVEMPSERAAGLGNTPGMFSLVDGTLDGGEDDGEDGATPRVRLLTHELLHNVVGDLDPEHSADGHSHTDHGWLVPHIADSPEETFLPDGIAEQIERDGFADHPRYVEQRPTAPASC